MTGFLRKGTILSLSIWEAHWSWVCFTGEMIVEHQNNSFPTKKKTCLVKQKCSWKTEPFLLKWPLFRGNVWIMLVFSGVAPPKGGLTLCFDNQCDSTLSKWPKPGYHVFLHRFLKHTCRRFKTYNIITQKKPKKRRQPQKITLHETKTAKMLGVRDKHIWYV